MIIGIPKEIMEGERRVALSPDSAAKLKKAGYEIIIESNAGLEAGFRDDRYESAGVKVLPSAESVYSGADIILKVQRPLFNVSIQKNETDLMKPDSLLISFLFPLNYPETIRDLAQKRINSISMDFIPRTTLAQKMDALSSQANVAGYKSVLVAANELGKMFPLLMTAAGTVNPAKVVIMGAGVAGLQALGTAKRLGAVVEVSDIRPSVKEEVKSLGGRFIELDASENLQDERGYAKEVTQEFLEKQKALIFKHITEADIVITTALVPGKKAPILVTEEMVKNMREGSVVVDMAVEFGGNCEISEAGKTVKKYGVTIVGEPNLASLVPYHASDLYSKNLLSLIQYIGKDGEVKLNREDEIVKSSLITHNGEIVNQRVKDIIK